MSHSNAYIIGFAAGVCVFCSIFVAGSAVALKDRQEANKVLDRQKNVLAVAGRYSPDSKLSADEIRATFQADIKPYVVDLDTGAYVEDIDAKTFDMRARRDDPEHSEQAPEGNIAKLQRIPDEGLVYHVLDGDRIEMIILPVEGKGLWSTLYGYVALAPDGTTIEGITFYEHAETPGLGGEVDNPRWKALWEGRKALDENGDPVIEVIKGQAGPPSEDPHKVDGLSGATLTARGVTNLMRFWLGDQGWGPYLDRVRAGGV